MSELGHNGGPRLEALTPAKKIERILSLLDRDGLTSAQKCVGVKIIAEADRDGTASIRTPELMRAASARDRETVFRATKALVEAGIEKASERGQAGRYVVLPDRVVAAVVEAYESNKSGRHEPDQSEKMLSVETRPVVTTDPVGTDPTSPDEPVGLSGTGRVEPVGMTPTSRHEPDQSEPCARARIVPPKGGLSYEEVINKSPPTPQASSSEEHAGHGVWVNCETIRHKDFQISLKALEIHVLGMPRDEMKAKALAHALQWAAEIESGKDPAKAVPNKVANFLATSLTADLNRAAVQSVRLGKARQDASGKRKLSRW